MKVEEIPIESIEIPADRARATFTDEQTAELRASIESNGFRAPILVRDLGQDRYELIDGEHRLQIMRDLGNFRIPAEISELDDTQASMLNILANTARGTQNPMDIAAALNKAKATGVTEHDLAAATGH